MVVIKRYTHEQLNFLKFTALVVDEFPKALRPTFKHMCGTTLDRDRTAMTLKV